MTSENVIKLDAETIQNFKERKLLKEKTESIDESELQPVAGREVAGVLTSNEILVYAELLSLRAGLLEYVEEKNKESLTGLADSMLSGSPPPKIECTDEVELFFAERAKYEYLSQMFWYPLRERLGGLHTQYLTIAAGFTVVISGPKF